VAKPSTTLVLKSPVPTDKPHCFSVRTADYSIRNAKDSKPHWVLGLPFLIAQFGIHGLHQFRAFQKVVCNNQEPKGKRVGENLVITNSNSDTSLSTVYLSYT
jgi:hypothetical protein